METKEVFEPKIRGKFLIIPSHKLTIDADSIFSLRANTDYSWSGDRVWYSVIIKDRSGADHSLSFNSEEARDKAFNILTDLLVTGY